MESAENREAIRGVYTEVANLGRTLTASATPPERKAALQRQLDTFERERLAQLPSISPECTA